MLCRLRNHCRDRRAQLALVRRKWLSSYEAAFGHAQCAGNHKTVREIHLDSHFLTRGIKAR